MDRFPLAGRTKIPRDEGWRERVYSDAELDQHTGNFGLRIGPGEGVLDVDPRHDKRGRTAEKIVSDLELEFGVDLSNAPRVRSGGGGFHFYVTLPEKCSKNLADKAEWKAVDLKQHGTFVVAPGSIHPETKRVYELEQGGSPVPLPAPLLAAWPKSGVFTSSPSETSLEHVQSLLSWLDVFQYQSREDWIKVLLECHSATGGSEEGFLAFAEWSSQDPAFAGDVDSWEYQWGLANGKRPGDRTLASLIARVMEAGGNPAPPASVDFADFTPDPLPPPPGGPYPATPFDPAALPRRSWLSEGVLLDGTFTLAVAKPACGKSLYAMHIGVMCALGVQWAHWRAAKPTRVLIVNAEDDRTEMQRRLAVIARTLDLDLNRLNGQIDLLGRGDRESWAIIRRAKDQYLETDFGKELRRLAPSYGLVVLDPLISLHAGMDENSNDHMQYVATELRRLAAARSVLVVHHQSGHSTGRGQSASRGASSLIGAARTQINLEPMDESYAEKLKIERRHRYVKVEGAKANYSELPPAPQWLQFAAWDVGNGDQAAAFREWSPPQEAMTGELSDRALHLIRTHEWRAGSQGPTAGRASREIAERLDLSEDTTQKWLKNMLKLGVLVDASVMVGKSMKHRLVLSDSEAERIDEVFNLQGKVPEDFSDDV